MAEDKTLYVIFGVIALVAIVAIVVLIAPTKTGFYNGNVAGQAFGGFDFSAIQSRFGDTSRTNTPEYLGPPIDSGEDEYTYGEFQGTRGATGFGGGAFKEYVAPLKNCIRGAADEIKGNVQSQCDPRTCIDACSASNANNQEALKACGQGCMEDFKTCTTQSKSEFNDKVRDCSQEYAPDPINECTSECDATTTGLNEFKECSSTCIKSRWVEPTKACVDQCKVAAGNPTTQEAAQAAKDQFTQCANTCLADFEQYLS